MSRPKVSIVIPCYNQGAYVDEAVESALAQTFRDFEIIIVNDGSTDPETNDILKSRQWPQTRVLHTTNQGLSMARNNGIREAVGDYILPLDADDRIGPRYLEQAAAVLDREPSTGIVYCLADCFGAQQGRWAIPPFSLRGMLFTNLIFCSALFRRDDWVRVGGYNANMKSGWEDWDFWLSLLDLGREVRQLPEVHFYYRVKEISMVKAMDHQKQVDMHLQLMHNHSHLFIDQARPLITLYYRVRNSRLYRQIKKSPLPRLVGRFLKK